MGDEVQVEQAESFQIPEIKSSLQAIAMIWQAMEFLLTNYKKTVFVVVVVAAFILVQVFTGFAQLKSMLSLVGL